MTKRQIHWASKHDWFVHSYQVKGFYVCVVLDHDLSDGGCTPFENTFSDFESLYAWAGY